MANCTIVVLATSFLFSSFREFLPFLPVHFPVAVKVTKFLRLIATARRGDDRCTHTFAQEIGTTTAATAPTQTDIASTIHETSSRFKGGRRGRRGGGSGGRCGGGR